MKKIDRKTLGIAIGVVILGLVLLRMLLSHGPTKPAGSFNFHPDSVLDFTWSVDGQSLTFRRPDHAHPWEPAVDLNILQKKLNALATVALSDMPAPGEGLSVELGFVSANRWKGVYRDNRFVWIEGPRKGQGFRTDGNWAKVFEEGRFAFQPHQWDWCQARPQKLIVQSDPVEFELYQKNHGWIMKLGNQEFQMDASTVEKWLSRTCQAQVDFYRDLKSFPMAGIFKKHGHFKVEFGPGGSAAKDYERKEDFWIQDDAKAAQSTSLAAAFIELTLLPHRPFLPH